MSFLILVHEENQAAFLPRILEIERLSFPSPWSIHAFREELKNPVSQLWALISHGALQGYVCFWMIDAEIHLLHIAVHPLARGNGFGDRLLGKMIDVGVSKGLDTAWLEVRVSNVVAQKLYRKHGFSDMGRRLRYYRDTNEDAIVMSLGFQAFAACHKAATK